VGAVASLAALASLLMGATSADPSSSWWFRAPALGRPISQIASDSGFRTLAISNGTAGWLDPSRGVFRPVSADGVVAYVAADGSSGLVLGSDGQLSETRDGGATFRVQQLSGSPRGLAIGFGKHPMVVAVTSSTLYLGHLGSQLSARGPIFRKSGPLALAAPVSAGESFVVAVGDGMFFISPSAEVTFSSTAPHLGTHASLADLGGGVVLAGDRRGLVWSRYHGSWSATFQILPYGGLGGVPNLTAITADGASAAYLGTTGFGTLLTPDGGYSWYTAPLPGNAQDVVAMATLGPVFSAKATGLVVAATPAGLVLHHLQPLPAPPAYTGKQGSFEILATALVTSGSALLVLVLMWLPARRRRRRLFV
jgi:hypothetical protein